MLCFFFFKQKTAYDMRISDWSSDVCSSDLVRAGLEGYGDRRRTIGVAGRRHIKQALYAIQLLLDYLSDILLQRRSFRPGICRPDREGGGRNRWILLNRKGLKRQYPGQSDAKRHDPGKNRPVDEETRSHPLGLTFLLRLGATLGRRLRLGDSDRLARLQLLQARYDDSITSLQSADRKSTRLNSSH